MSNDDDTPPEVADLTLVPFDGKPNKRAGTPQRGQMSRERFIFCEAILRGARPSEAYIRAGFSPKASHANGIRWLREPEIQHYLAVRRAELRDKSDLTDERLVEELQNIALLDPGEVVVEDITKPEDILKLPEHVRRAIVGWKYDRWGNFLLEFANKMTAIEMLGRHRGMFQKDRNNERDAPGDLLTTVFWRYVMSRHAALKEDFSSCILYAQTNPDEVEEWGKEVALLQKPEAESTSGE